jgi:hypothetical protein
LILGLADGIDPAIYQTKKKLCFIPKSAGPVIICNVAVSAKYPPQATLIVLLHDGDVDFSRDLQLIITEKPIIKMNPPGHTRCRVSYFSKAL